MNQSVDYEGYQAAFRPRSKGAVHDAARRAYGWLRQRVLYDTLLFPYATWHHNRLLATSDRSQGHTYTGFHRTPAQLEAIRGPVLEHLGVARDSTRPLDILVFAGSNGAEAFTLASVLRATRPSLPLHIVSTDLHDEMVARGRQARYSRDEVLHHAHVTQQFLESTFIHDGSTFTVKPEIRQLVQFEQANMLDASSGRRFAPADIVVAQNVFCHLRPWDAEQAFHIIRSCLKPRGVLLLNGMDLGLRSRLTDQAGLRPLAFNARRIHDESRSHVSLAWWRYYYGIEPYCGWRRDALRRYSTIFMQG